MKKFLPIFLIIIFSSMVAAKTTQAIGIEEIFASLSDKLYSLRNLLIGDIYLPATCYTYDKSGIKTLSQLATIAPSSRITETMRTCTSDGGCQAIYVPKAPLGCCYCKNQENSDWEWAALNTYGTSSITSFRTTYCSCNPNCPADPDCKQTPVFPTNKTVKCASGRCLIEDKSGTLPTLYNCNTSTYQCVEAANGTYDSISTCQDNCKAPGSIPAITNAQRSCTSDYNCKIIETDCCGCAYGTGYDFKTKQSINKNYASQFTQQLSTYCTNSKLRPCTLNGPTNTCYLTPTAKCVSSLCTAVWPAPKVATLTSTMRKCTKDTDCVLAESACCGCDKGGNDTSKVGINKYYLTTYNKSVLTFCQQSQAKCTSTNNNCGTVNVACENSLCVAKPQQASNNNSSTLWFTQDGMIQPGDLWYDSVKACKNGATAKSWETCLDEYLKTQNITAITIRIGEEPSGNVCLALGCELPTINIEVASAHKDKMKSLGFEETVNPGVAPTYQWYKANVTLGNPQELWYQAVVSCAPQNSTKEKWEQCFKDYFVIQKIGIKQLIVGTVPTGSCTPTGCQAPAIQIQVSQEFKAQMVALGFSEIDDPTKPVDPYITKIDLAKQGLLYGIDKTNNNIVYEIVDKTASVECGDGVCATVEKYLYEIDLMQNCSINDEEIINYKHCYSDCKGKMDTGKSVTKAEFNLLKPQCSNKPVVPEETKTDTFMPLPKKPIAQMTQAEKTEYIKELQVFLIELLTQLLNMLRAQRGL